MLNRRTSTTAEFIRAARLTPTVALALHDLATESGLTWRLLNNLGLINMHLCHL